MPRAGGSIAEQVKYHYQDHDTDEVLETPPVQNTWYPVMDREDVRLLACTIYQKNDEAVAKLVEVRWTVDGTVYFTSFALLDDTNYWVWRSHGPSAGGTAGITTGVAQYAAAYYVDKRGQSFKVEIRMTAVPGTNQILRGRCVPETLEAT